MASILKVDELQGITSAGDITVTSEGGAATQSLQQGLNKAWICYSQLSSTTTHDSLNISSLGDDATGRATVNFSNDFSNANYAGSACSVQTSNVCWRNNSAEYLAGSISVLTQDHTANGQDDDKIGVQFTGDLA